MNRSDMQQGALNYRARSNPKEFLLHVIGHLNGVHTLGQMTDFEHYLATEPIWDAYIWYLDQE